MRFASVFLSLTFALSITNPGWAEDRIDFARHIRPILAAKCFQCHGPDAHARQANLRLDRRADLMGAVVPGKLQQSKLYQRITASDAHIRMPPVTSRFQLTHDEKSKIQQWITKGAPWSNHWAFTPPRLPTFKNSRHPTRRFSSPIDRLIAENWKNKSLTIQKPADRETFIRRVTFDLTGLPPTLLEIDQYLADTSPLADERLVDRLLASPRFGEHWAFHWMQAARYADTDGHQLDTDRQMHRWKDWVINAYNRGIPYDQFSIEQLAGDLLPNPTDDQFTATAFNRHHSYDHGSGTIRKESIFNNACDRVETTTKVWMGLTVGCAKCHDHKFDPISQKEFYQLLAFFNQVPENGQAIGPGNSHPYRIAPTPPQRQRLQQLEKQCASAKTKWKKSQSTLKNSLDAWRNDVIKHPDKLNQFLVTRGLTYRNAFDIAGQEGFAFGPGNKTVKGRVGNALKLDGFGGINLGGNVGNVRPDKRWTLAVWINPNRLASGAIYSQMLGEEDQYIGTTLEINNGRLHFLHISRWVSRVTGLVSKTKLKSGKWYHLVITCDGRQQALAYHMYLNGKPVEVESSHDTAGQFWPDDLAAPLIIGQSVFAPGYDGSLDDLRFYNRVLRTDEISTLANGKTARQLVALEPAKRTKTDQIALRNYFLENAASKDVRNPYDLWINSETNRQKYYDQLPTVMIMKDLKSRRPTYVCERGVWNEPREKVLPQVPKILPTLPNKENPNRLTLARWLFRPDHPLTARVAVNQIWQQLFGQGLVATPENWGVQCPAPRQQPLLDWLALEFIRTRWNTKSLIRTIVLSDAYKRSSSAPARDWKKDPYNQYFARGPRTRLSGPMIRDQALFVSGLLAERQGGPPVKPYQPPGLWLLTSNKSYEPSQGADLYRRSVYTFWRRSIAPPTMALFDCPDRGFSSVGIKRTNTPLQALAALNEASLMECSQQLAMRMMLEGGDQVSHQLAFGYRLATGKKADAKVQEILNTSYEDYFRSYVNDPLSAKDLWNSPYDQDSNFEGKPARARKYLPQWTEAEICDLAQQAAFLATANALLNLDATLSKP